MKNKRITRSHNNRVIGGVAGGLGEYLNIDPTILRVLFVFLAFFGGGGLILYVILLFVMPDTQAIESQQPPTIDPDPIIIDENGEATFSSAKGEDKKTADETFASETKNKNGIAGWVIGLLLIFIGGFIFLSKFYEFNWSEYFVPCILIAAGCALLFIPKKLKQ